MIDRTTTTTTTILSSMFFLRKFLMQLKVVGIILRNIYLAKYGYKHQDMFSNEGPFDKALGKPLVQERPPLRVL